MIAPASFNAAAPATSVPAVSTMSSVITTIFPSTSPITVVTRATCCSGRSLFRTTRSPPIISANLPASFVRPVSGRHRCDRLLQLEVTDVLREERDRRHVVDGDVEEALHLAGVEIHREHAVGAGGLQHVRDEARA